MRIVLFGDSVIAGVGASHRNKGCSRLLRRLLPSDTIVIKGRSGDTTFDGLKRLGGDVLGDSLASHVVVTFGNNDCRLKDIDTPTVTLTEYKNNLTEILRGIKLSGKIPLLSNLQPIDSEMFYDTLPEMNKFMRTIGDPAQWQEKYSLACEDVAFRQGVKLVNIRAPLEGQKKDVIALDGLHPNDSGHRIIAEMFSRFLT